MACWPAWLGWYQLSFCDVVLVARPAAPPGGSVMYVGVRMTWSLQTSWWTNTGVRSTIFMPGTAAAAALIDVSSVAAFGPSHARIWCSIPVQSTLAAVSPGQVVRMAG